MAATELQVSVEVNFTLLQNKVDKILEDDTVKLAIHNALARYCHPYVPYLYGPLSETVEITPEYIKYIQPYARRQYYGDGFNFTKDYHPLATSRWDQAMMQDRGDQFSNEIQELLIRKLRELNG